MGVASWPPVKAGPDALRVNDGVGKSVRSLLTVVTDMEKFEADPVAIAVMLMVEPETDVVTGVPVPFNDVFKAETRPVRLLLWP